MIFYGYISEEIQIDHRDLNKVNNLIDNLRLATSSQNACNRGKRRGCSSEYKGVSFHKATGKWASQIQVDGKRKSLGFFVTELEAHLAWCKVAKEIHGEFFNAG